MNQQSKPSWSTAGAKMQLIGILCAVGGIIWGVSAYQMSTTEGYFAPMTEAQRVQGYAVGEYKQVHNIGRIAEQQKNILCAGFVAVSGILLFGFGSSILQSKIAASNKPDNESTKETEET